MRMFSIAALLLAGLLFAPIAWAEDGEPEGNDISEEIKKQMDKILQLMKDNQDALIKLSANQDAETKKVDVTVPPSDSKDGASSKDGAKGDGQSGEAGTSGQSAAEAIKKLLEGQQKGSTKIPSEIEELLQMIPT